MTTSRSHCRRCPRRLLPIVMATLVIAASAMPATAQDPATGAAAGPDDWDVEVGSLPVAIQLSVPPALPIDVGAGAGFAGMNVSSLPLGLASAGPVHAPVIDALGLLGGTGALLPIALELIPALILGGSTIFGLPPAPIDPGLLPAIPLPPLPSPELPIVQCTAKFPGDPREVTCGGPSQGLLGYEMRAFSGVASVSGDPLNPDTIDARSSVRGAGLQPQEGMTLLPMDVGTIAASSRVRVEGPAVQASTAVELGRIDLLDGLLEIDSIHSGLGAALSGRVGEAALERDVCRVSGVRIAGVPVEIDSEGITVGDAAQANPLSGLLAPLAGELDRLSGETVESLSLPLDVGRLAIRPLPVDPPSIAEDGTRIETRVSCVEITYTIAASGSSIRIVLGQSAVSMSAFRRGEFTGTSSAPDGLPGAVASGDGPGAATAGQPRSPAAPLATPEPIRAGEGAPPPSSAEVFRTVAARAADWWPVLLAMLVGSVAVIAAVRGRRAVWRVS